MGFVNKGIVGAAKVFGLHTYRLSLSFAFYGLINGHIPFLLELRFGDAIGKSGASCYLLCHGLGQFQGLIANAIKKPPPFTLRSCHGLTRIKQLAGSTLADNPG